ncbi:MAG TPA: hypothetical protein VLG09_01910 [Candidatus Saccharimonadales bacterium]|nr:hypothetical protein [Candidatus Saccharimonadales bacterium]
MTRSPDQHPMTTAEVRHALGAPEAPMPEFPVTLFAGADQAFDTGAVAPSPELESDTFDADVIDLALGALAHAQDHTA